MNAGSRKRFLADIGKKSVLFQAKLTVNMPIALDSISVPGHQVNYNLLSIQPYSLQVGIDPAATDGTGEIDFLIHNHLITGPVRWNDFSA